MGNHPITFQSQQLKINIRNIKDDDCNILHAWLQEPHVREFWDDGNRTVEQTRSYYYQNNGVERFIFLINNQPAGYIQAYDVKLHSEYTKFSKENKKTLGIDFFIGNKQFLEKGLAKIIMQTFIEYHCADAARMIVDPDPNNKKAIHVYETCGFVKQRVCLINHETHLIMYYDRETP